MEEKLTGAAEGLPAAAAETGLAAAGRSAAAGDLSAEGSEAGANLAAAVDAAFALREKDWDQYAPLTLAWIGDTVFDLVVRTVLVKHSDRQAQKLHRAATEAVNARMQARMAAALQEQALLTEEEQAIYRRGRNASPAHNAKNAERREYLDATGLEALIGWLYLKKRTARLTGLIRAGLEACGVAL